MRVDGAIATLGQRADPSRSRIEVDGKPIAAQPLAQTLMLHKPRNVIVSARDERGRRTVFALLPDAPLTLRYVGRLDRDTSGLLLFTTDGELAHRLTHPRYHVDKTYHATVPGEPGDEALRRLLEGVALEDGPARATAVEMLERMPSESRVALTLREGRKRQVRRMLEAIGHPVRVLHRVAFAGLELGDLGAGASRELADAEERSLRVLVGLDDA